MRPVATSAAVYPDATEGLIDFVGVKDVEQLEDDCPKTCIMIELSSIAVPEQESGDMIKIYVKEAESSSITHNKAGGAVGWCFIAEEESYKFPALRCTQAMHVQSTLPLCRMAKSR